MRSRGSRYTSVSRDSVKRKVDEWVSSPWEEMEKQLAQARHLLERSWSKKLERLDESMDEIVQTIQQIESDTLHYKQLTILQKDVNLQLSDRVQVFEQQVSILLPETSQ